MVIPAASRLKNVDWATQTLLFGWSSQGIWPAEVDGTEVSRRLLLFLSMLIGMTMFVSHHKKPLGCTPSHSLYGNGNGNGNGCGCGCGCVLSHWSGKTSTTLVEVNDTFHAKSPS